MVLFTSGFKFSQLEMSTSQSHSQTVISWPAPLICYTETILSVLIPHFKFSVSPNEDKVVWNYSIVRYPTVGKADRPSFPVLMEPIQITEQCTSWVYGRRRSLHFLLHVVLQQTSRRASPDEDTRTIHYQPPLFAEGLPYRCECCLRFYEEVENIIYTTSPPTSKCNSTPTSSPYVQAISARL